MKLKVLLLFPQGTGQEKQNPAPGGIRTAGASLFPYPYL